MLPRLAKHEGDCIMFGFALATINILGHFG
jgi:hypothetical protein